MSSGASTPPSPPASPQRHALAALSAPYFTTPPLHIVDRPADAHHTSGPRSASTIRIIVIHATAGPLESSLNWLTVNPNSSVSAHRVIAEDGQIFKLCDDLIIANHVGFSRMGNTTNLNPQSLGIELVNSNSGYDPYEHAQLMSAALQLTEWMGLYGALPIVSHASVDTKGKTDPRNFPWGLLYELLFDALRGVL